MAEEKRVDETQVALEPKSAAKDYRILLATVAGLIAAYLLWNFVIQKPVIYLTDLAYAVESFEWMPPEVGKSIDGNPLKIGNTIYSSGLGCHAKTEITVDVPRGMRQFIAEVGVDAEVGADMPATVRFIVEGNGVELAVSEVLRAGELPYQIVADVQGYTILTLIIDDAGDGNRADHADWANARFLR